tara:strand:- start:6325 stop:6612 length:288 start_codon:yes stop_codon:yes gene_type:complete
MENNKKYKSRKAVLKPGVKNRRFKVLEDDRDLSFIGAIAASATNEAYHKAVAISESIIEVEDGKVIRKQKDGSFEVIQTLAPRKSVQKGKTITIP